MNIKLPLIFYHWFNVYVDIPIDNYIKLSIKYNYICYMMSKLYIFFIY